MSTYRLPGVTVNILDNPRIINIGGDVRIPAIVGLGPVTRAVTDEAVIRATGSIDYLSVYPANGVAVSQYANTPGVIAGGLNYQSIFLNGALYNAAVATASVIGSIRWPQGGATADWPSTGSVYYVTYTYAPPMTQLDPYTTQDKEELKARYGAQDTNTGILTTAGLIALENGAPAVMLVQASGSSYSETTYKAAIDKLQKKTNIEQLVVVFPASVTRTQQETLLTYAYSHVIQMSNLSRERGLMSGSPSGYYTATGFDVIGDAATNPSYVYRATALKNRNSTYVVPSRIQRKNDLGVTMELDGNFAAAGVAGVQAAQTLQCTPIHGYPVVGITIEDEKWNEFEMDQLGAGNCLVLESRAGVVTIRDAITTDPTSADTQEISVVSVQRLVKRTLRETLKNTYTNKGKVINSNTTSAVEATTNAVLSSLVTAGEIYEFGESDNPTTGEVKISAQQNRQEPRQIDVTCSYKPLYPLKWVVVTTSVYV